MSIKTFWIEPTEEIAYGLRRYASGGGAMTCEEGYHSATVHLELRRAAYTDHGGFRSLALLPEHDRDDPRWPKRCSECEYEFAEDDHWQPWQDLLYRRYDTGEAYVLRGHPGRDVLGIRVSPPGATWDAWWMGDWARGADGVSLMVRLPNGDDWCVDSEASNCTRKGDRSHKCWIRHGAPRECRVTVDKNGDTCQAGGGSIQSGSYHGFLQNGVLT